MAKKIMMTPTCGTGCWPASCLAAGQQLRRSVPGAYCSLSYGSSADHEHGQRKYGIDPEKQVGPQGRSSSPQAAAPRTLASCGFRSANRRRMGALRRPRLVASTLNTFTASVREHARLGLQLRHELHHHRQVVRDLVLVVLQTVGLCRTPTGRSAPDRGSFRRRTHGGSGAGCARVRSKVLT